MKNTLLVMAVAALTAVNGFAQEAVVAAGGNASGEAGSISYSVGQVAYTVATSENGSVSAGVQQQYVIEENPTNIEVEYTVELRAFPNPTTDKLTLQLGTDDTDGMAFTLADASGRTLLTAPITERSTQIDMTTFASQMYILRVTAGEDVVKVFRILKK